MLWISWIEQISGSGRIAKKYILMKMYNGFTESDQTWNFFTSKQNKKINISILQNAAICGSNDGMQNLLECKLVQNLTREARTIIIDSTSVQIQLDLEAARMLKEKKSQLWISLFEKLCKTEIFLFRIKCYPNRFWIESVTSCMTRYPVLYK